jgi:hypothetical protein
VSVNYTCDDAKYPEGRCLTSDLIRQIFEADRYQKGVDKKVYDDVPNPANYPVGKGRGEKDRSRKDNARDASKILRRWIDVECRQPTVRYICSNLPELREHLSSHHRLSLDVPATSDSSTVQPTRDTDDASVDDVDSHEVTAFIDQLLNNTSPLEQDVCADFPDNSSADSADVNCQPEDETVNAVVDPCPISGVVDNVATGGYDFEEIVQLLSEIYVGDSSEFLGRKSDDVTNNCQSGVQDDVVRELPPKPSVRMCFAIAKATIPLNDSQCTKLLTIFDNVRPDNYDDMIKDGRYLAPPDPAYLKQMKVRKVVCGLTKADFVPFHDAKKRAKMMRHYEKTGSTIDNTSGKYPEGDILDFDVEKNILMTAPGNPNVKGFRKLLERTHAARPNLLSPDLLFIVDKGKFYDELLTPNPARPKMNLFSLMVHSDGVQIAKNSSLPECSPISFAIDRIYPFDSETGTWDEAQSLRIPSTMLVAQTISVYHGKGAADLFQYMEHFKKEMRRLSPTLHIVAGKGEPQRKLVVSHRLTIADSVERCKRTGENLSGITLINNIVDIDKIVGYVRISWVCITSVYERI